MTDGTEARPFDALRRVLADDPGGVAELGDERGAATMRLDLDRRARTGIPEFVHAEHKPAEAVAAALVRLAERPGRALASRVPPEMAERIPALAGAGWESEWHPAARVLVLKRPGSEPPRLGGRVGIVGAGTSDVPVAAEAALVAREMGAEVREVYDVGVAGLHRLVRPLEGLIAWGADVLVAAAGMDGAMPSVVAGLVDVPVIGLPAPVGYGIGAAGLGAMTTMLQSCAPGLVVVNVGNGVGAGSTAAMIANRVAAARRAVEGGEQPGDG
ncbi:MAG: nickel pincer cofactor biosynthesis protein LarB [Chloroflexota bacterium]